MITIQVYNPPMCCSTGLCGTEIDPALVSFAALLTELSQKGVKVERYNMGLQRREEAEHRYLREVVGQQSIQTAWLSWKPEEPVRPDALARLAASDLKPALS